MVGATLLLALLVQPWTPAVSLLVAAFCAIAVYELLYATDVARSPWLLVPSVLLAVTVPFWVDMGMQAATIVLLLYTVLLGTLTVVQHERIRVQQVAYAVFLTLLSSLSLSSIAYLRRLPQHGLMLTILVLLVPWVSDTGAYFTGTFFGKHKLCPKISPKKTVEGLIGGILLAVIVEVAAAGVYSAFQPEGAKLNLWLITAMALIGAPLSVFGDLFASLIKRQCGIKDYGNLFPGHGGVMDRFDSFLFVSFPAYVAVNTLPFIC